MMVFRRDLLRSGLILGAVTLASACIPAAPAAPSPTPVPAAPFGLTIAIQSQSMPTFPLFLAQHQGFLEQEGLAVDWLIVSAATNIATAVIDGNVPVALASITPLLSPSAVGDVAVVATPSNHYAYSLVVRPEVKAFSDLPGKVAAVSAASGQDDFALTAVLQANNVQPESVRRLAVGAMAQRLAAMQSGHIDCTLFTPPYDVIVQRQGLVVLARLYESVRTPVAQDVIYTTRAWAQAHRPQLVGFLRAYVRAIRFGKANPDATKQLINQWVQAADDDLLQSSFQAYFGSEFESDPTPSTAAIQANINQNAQLLGQPATLRPDQVIDSSYIQQALAGLTNND